MTAIIAYRNDGDVYMAGDSKASDGGYSNFSIATKKVFKKDQLIIGVAGLACPLQCIRDIYEPLKHDSKWSDDEYMTRLSFDIKHFLEKYISVQLDDPSSMVLLIGYHGNIYYMTPDHSMNRINGDGFWVGSGGDVSFAAMKAFLKSGCGITESMLEGLAIAGQINVTVGPPYYVDMV